MHRFKIMYPQLAPLALWEYFENDTFLKENYSLTVIITMISRKPSMDLQNLCQLYTQRIHNLSY